MRSEILSQENNVVSIKLEFETEEFAKGVEKAIKDLSSKINVPGFRKGHVPRKVLEMKFGRDALYAEAIEDMLPDAIQEIVKDYDLDLIDEPHVKIEKMEEGSPVDVRLSFEVTPEVTLPEFQAISVERPVAVVSDETVTETVKEIRVQNSTLSPVEDRPAAEHNVVDVEYYTVVLSGEGKEERHGPDTAPLDLEQPSVRSEIRAAILGKNIGESASVDIQVEEDYQDKKVAGRTIRYELTVKEIKEKILPELNPEFFKKVLQKECETEEAFFEEIKSRILEKIRSDNQSKAEFDALAKVSELSALSLPETLISRQIAAMKKEDEENIQKNRNMSVEEMLAEASTTKEEYENSLRKQAEEIVRRTLVLDKVADEMAITVEKEDFETEMQTLAASYNIDVQRLVEGLFKDEKRVLETANRIKYKKTVKAIMNAIQVIDTEPAEKPAAGTEKEAETETAE